MDQPGGGESRQRQEKENQFEGHERRTGLRGIAQPNERELGIRGWADAFLQRQIQQRAVDVRRGCERGAREFGARRVRGRAHQKGTLLRREPTARRENRGRRPGHLH